MVILRLAAHSLASSPKCPILATRQVAWLLTKVTDKTRRYCANMCPVSWSDRGLPASLDRKRALDSAKALISLSMSALTSPKAPTHKPRRSPSPSPPASSSSLVWSGPASPSAVLGQTSHQCSRHGIPAGPRSQQCVLTSPSSWGSSLPGFTVSVNDNMTNSCAASTQY